MNYEHLKFSREAPLTDRHRKKNFVPYNPPEDPRIFGTGLHRSFEVARQPPTSEVAGYDNRILFKISLRDNVSLPELGNIPGVELVSHEDRNIVLAFADQTGLSTFESRLSSLMRDGTATRKELLYALQSFDNWTAEDRKGAALRQYDFPDMERFVLDVELWPLERPDQRNSMLTNFCTKLHEKGVEKLDELNQPSLVMVRIRCTKTLAETYLLNHRDVRAVDLPPRTGVSVEMFLSDINQFPPPPLPPEDAPAIAVLDAGLSTGHPLLKNAIGDAQGYLGPDHQPHDNPPLWHGTFVSGLALYGDVQKNIENGQFIPQLQLFSGKVFKDDGSDQTEFVEKAVDRAVRELHLQYRCRVFNLSYGDANKVYDGRHVRGLAYTLDRLTRELGVLFVVPTGNLHPKELPSHPHREYPEYLLHANARLVDPATALNVLTVGGLTRHVATHNAQRYPGTIEDIPIAQAADLPFPLGRSGFSIGGAIKPDLVDHAGNIAVMRSGGRTVHNGLGIISACGDFASGRLFAENIGTSYAAPQVAHRAACLLKEMPDASANLLRVVLSAHARWPESCIDLLNSTKDIEGKKRLLQLIGYGRIDDEALYRSMKQTITLVSEDSIANDKCHFYELPIPSSFWSVGKRLREITVALAYSPDIRTTRLDYRMSKLWFTLVKANSLDEVVAAFKRNREEGMGEINNNRWISNQERKAGTLQVSRWGFKLPPHNETKMYVVVSRQDTSWGTVAHGEEPYALVAVFADRENAHANLYAEVRTQLEARVKARIRARI